jgi:TonB family protein
MAAVRLQQLGWAVCWASFAVVVLSAQSADWERLVREGDAALANRDFATATELFQSAVAVGETFPDNDPRRPRALMRLARVHRADGDLASPEDIYRQADRAALATWGRESVEYSDLLNEVGRYYHRRRKHLDAERFYLDSFGTRVRLLGKEHAAVAESIVNLAIIYENLFQFQKAEVYYQTALDIRERLLGPDDLRTIENKEHLARLLHGLQRHDEAAALELEAREARAPRLRELEGEQVELDTVPLSEVSRPPELIEQIEPNYSDEGRIGRSQGTVAIRVEIDDTGVPRNLRVVRRIGLGLDENALKAVRQWRFRPARQRGRPVACRLTYEINFTLL